MPESSRDPLTGLPDRALLLDRLAHALLRNEHPDRRVAVLLLDLDSLQGRE